MFSSQHCFVLHYRNISVRKAFVCQHYGYSNDGDASSNPAGTQTQHKACDDSVTVRLHFPSKLSCAYQSSLSKMNDSLLRRYV